MKTKGVSLIVLIITIIVLAILATISIITIKNTGIINDASDAAEDFELPQVQELASFAWGEARIKGLKTSKEIKEYVIAEIKKVFSEEILAKYDIEVTKKKVVVSLAGQGGSGDDVAGGGTTPEPDLPENSLVAMYKAGTLKQGDYVDYTPSPADSWTLTYDNDGSSTITPENLNFDSAIPQEELNWRVLGYDEENNELLLIAGSPTRGAIDVGYFTFLAYNNYINALDSTCRALYSNTTLGAVARSVNINDLDVYLGGNAYDKTIYGNEVDENGNVTQIKPGGYGYIPTDYYSKWYVDSTTGDFGYSETEKLFNYPNTVYSFDFQDITPNAMILEILSGPNRDYEYWLASRGVHVGNGGGLSHVPGVEQGCVARVRKTIIGFTERLVDISNAYLIEVLPTTFRPIVALPVSITADDVPLIENAPQETWVYPPEYDSLAGENWD